MSRLLPVGNDVVDLGDPRVRGKAADRRFVARVLAPEEAAVVARAAEPDRTLWSIWAAKETAYKVASKVRGAPPVFEHAAFVVALSDPGDGARLATVAWEDVRVAVTVHDRADVLHAVGRPAGAPHPAVGTAVRSRVHTGQALLDGPDLPWAAPLEDLLPRFSDAERDAIHSRASAAVRLAARSAIAAGLGIDEARLRIVCAPGRPGRRPPRVLLDGAPGGVDVSLSHHGRWIAWAWSGPDAPDGAGAA